MDTKGVWPRRSVRRGRVVRVAECASCERSMCAKVRPSRAGIRVENDSTLSTSLSTVRWSERIKSTCEALGTVLLSTLGQPPSLLNSWKHGAVGAALTSPGEAQQGLEQVRQCTFLCRR